MLVLWYVPMLARAFSFAVPDWVIAHNISECVCVRLTAHERAERRTMD